MNRFFVNYLDSFTNNFPSLISHFKAVFKQKKIQRKCSDIKGYFCVYDCLIFKMSSRHMSFLQKKKLVPIEISWQMLITKKSKKKLNLLLTSRPSLIWFWYKI